MHGNRDCACISDITDGPQRCLEAGSTPEIQLRAFDLYINLVDHLFNVSGFQVASDLHYTWQGNLSVCRANTSHRMYVTKYETITSVRRKVRNWLSEKKGVTKGCRNL